MAQSNPIEREERKPVAISAALSGDLKANVPLHNGDVVTIRQLPDGMIWALPSRCERRDEASGTYGSVPAKESWSSGAFRRWQKSDPEAYPVRSGARENTGSRELEIQSSKMQ